MRLAAEAKMGFYPVNLSTIDLLCGSLAITNPAEVTILDPCCGQGLALEHFGKTLKVPRENLYGVELDDGRAAEASQRLGQVLHCSFFNAKITPVQSFSIAWLNPPYDNELKQDDGNYSNQLEVTFVRQAARYVAKGGLIILHCPADRVGDEVRSIMNTCCEDVVRLNLPKELQPFRETVLVGRRRQKIDGKDSFNFRVRSVDSLPGYEVEEGCKPRAFEKLAPTDAEIVGLLEKAHFWKPFKLSPPKTKLTPILPLGAGHLGLTLASGHLDGYFEPPGYEPHVVRGIAYKQEQLVSQDEECNEDGKVTTTTTTRENIKLKIRAVTAQGIIHEIK